MKNLIKFFAAIVLLSALIIPSTAASANQDYPESINGLPVIFVQTSENTAWISDDTTVIVLLDTSNKLEESAEKLSSYVSKNPLPEGWSIEVIGGENVSKETILQNHKANNDIWEQCWPIQLGGPPSQTSNKNDVKGVVANTLRSPSPTFAIDSPTDPGSETITYIGARWIAPQIGSYQDNYSALLVNGMTDDDYFLQSGQVYHNGVGYNIWADNDTGYIAVPYNIQYVTGHDCEYFVALFWDDWVMWMRDYTAGQWDYYYEPNAVGTRLINDIATSVFFENWNTNSSWYTGFTNPISVSNAYNGIATPAQVHKWNNDYITILDTYGSSQPNNNIITGRLRNFGTAYWHLDNILLKNP
jgi:hypothetical protein